MSGTNKGSVFTETFGTTSPVTGSAPTLTTDGQPLDGLESIRVVVSAASGETLSGAGTLDCYLFDPSIINPDGSGESQSAVIKGVPYDTATGTFVAGRTVYNITATKTAVVVDSDAVDFVAVSGATGAFSNNDVLAQGMALANGTVAATLYIAYDNLTGAFTSGQVVTGAPSTAFGTIDAIEILTATTGILTISSITGNFTSSDTLSDPITGAADCDGAQFKKLDYDTGLGTAFTAARTLYSYTSGATAVIQATTSAAATGTLHLTSITGTFGNNDVLAEKRCLQNGSSTDCIATDLTGGFEALQELAGGTSGADATIDSVVTGALYELLNLSSIVGVFVVSEILTGATPARWSRYPAYDLTVNGTARDEVFTALAMLCPRKSLIQWIPTGVDFSAGTGGVKVTQLGQTFIGLHNAGKWGG